MVRRLVPALLAPLLAACASSLGDGPSGSEPLGPDLDGASPAAFDADLSRPLRLADLLPPLLARNPDVAAARARLEAAAERWPQAISLPDPMVEVRWFARNPMDPEDRFTRYDLMVRQDVPFPVLLALRGEQAEREAEAAALQYEAAVRDAVAALSDVHAERAYLAAAARVEEAVLDIYRRHAELARGEGGSGRTRLPESFRAEALLAQAGYELTLIREMLAVEDQRLRALLALPRETVLGEPEDVRLLPVELDESDLVRRALTYNQELREAGVDVESARIGARRARWEYAPMLSLGVGRMVNDAFDMETGETRDGTTVTVGVTVPIWFQAKAAGVREADARLRAAQADAAAQRERLVADVARAAFRIRNAGRLAQLYGAELVPQAELALLRSQELVREGKESLASSLELAAAWQQLRIAELRAVADQAQALAALERLLGTTLQPVPRAGAEAGR